MRADARARLSGLHFDLLILDVMMPGESGFDLAKSLRETSSVPILMLTARDEAAMPHRGPADRRRRLCRQAVRAARAVAAHRQHPQARAAGGAAARSKSVRFGEFVFHIARGELRRGEDMIRLTDRERDMLRVLAATPGETVPRLALAGNDPAANERAVDVQVNRLRRKIERDPANPLFVQTVRGIGYRLVVSP